MATKEKTPNVEEPKKIETTAGGNNYRYQDTYEQGKNNALVWTGHVAWLPERENLTLNEPEKGKRFNLSNERNLNLPEKPETQAQTTNTNTWNKSTTINKMTQPQEPVQPEWFRENGVRYKDATDRNTQTNGAEFGWLQNAIKEEDKNAEETAKEEKKEEPKGQDVNAQTFLQGSTTELFGKLISWADTAPYDHNSIEWKKAEARLAQYQKINALSVDQLASSLKSWSILAWWQAMRDLQTYNPEKYQLLQEYQKKEDTLNQINMIASGKAEWDTSLQDKTWESINNYLNETVANAGWDNLARADLDNTLSQNQWLINYAERMSYYAQQINQLDQTIGNLEEDIRKQYSKTTWENVLEYQLQNIINNRSKKLYKQRDNLMNQYNYYKGVYEAQVEQEATAWERNYKERQLALQESKAIWDQAMDQANLDYKNQQLNYNYYKLNADNPLSESAVQGWVNAYISSIQDKIANNAKIRSWWCGTVVNDYLKSIGINFAYDDNKSTKLNSITPWAWPKVWSIAVWDKTGTTAWDKYWHVAIVTWVNKDGTITVLESNENTGLRYHTYKQSGVTGYYDPTASSKKSSSSKKEEKVYTNDENLTRLMQWKISYSDFVKNRQWNEFADEIEKYVWTHYFEKKPLMFMSDLDTAIDDLTNILNQWWGTEEERKNALDEATKKAELYTLDYLSNSQISNQSIMKMVKKYLDWVWNADDNIVTYLSYALAWRYTDKKTLDNDLDVIWYKDTIWKKDRAKAIWKIREEDGIV